MNTDTQLSNISPFVQFLGTKIIIWTFLSRQKMESCTLLKLIAMFLILRTPNKDFLRNYIRTQRGALSVSWWLPTTRLNCFSMEVRSMTKFLTASTNTRKSPNFGWKWERWSSPGLLMLLSPCKASAVRDVPFPFSVWLCKIQMKFLWKLNKLAIQSFV